MYQPVIFAEVVVVRKEVSFIKKYWRFFVIFAYWIIKLLLSVIGPMIFFITETNIYTEIPKRKFIL